MPPSPLLSKLDEVDTWPMTMLHMDVIKLVLASAPVYTTSKARESL